MEKTVNDMKNLLCAIAVIAALAYGSVAQGAVVSWLSTSNSLANAGEVPNNPNVGPLTGGDTGTLYIWAHNSAKLDSLAYDVLTSDPAKVMVTGNTMFNPAVLITGTRWDNPVNLGTIDAGGNLLNMYGFALTTQGLDPATRGLAGVGDAGWSTVANPPNGAGLIAQINFEVKGDPCAGLDCMMVPVQLQLRDGAFGTVSAGVAETTTNGMATIMVAMAPEGVAPIVDDVYHMTMALNEIVGPLMPMDSAPGTPPVTWSGLQNPTYMPGFGAPLDAAGINHQPTWDPLTQKFNWDTGGSSRGTYMWEVTASNAIGQDTGKITVDVKFIPEPASLTLIGLAMIGLVGFARRRGL
jgi:hypothetical protein